MEVIIGVGVVTALFLIFGRKKKRNSSVGVVRVAGIQRIATSPAPRFLDHLKFALSMAVFGFFSPVIASAVHPILFDVQSKGWLPSEPGSFGDLFGLLVAMVIITAAFSLIINRFTYKMKELPPFGSICILLVAIYVGVVIFSGGV